MRLLSPVFFKEVRQLAHSARFFGMKLVYLIALLLCYGLFHAMMSFQMEHSEIGRELAMTVSVLELLAVVVLTPVFTADVVSGEVEAGTLGLLFLTRLKSWNIVQDKGLSRIGAMFQLCVLSLPFLFAAVLYGGVQSRQLIAVFLFLMSAILVSGGLALLCSCFLRSYSGALATSYVMLVVFYFMLPVVVDSIRLTTWFIIRINPFAAITSVFYPFGGIGDMNELCWTNLAVGLVVYGLAVIIAALALRRRSLTPITGWRRRRSGLRRVLGWFSIPDWIMRLPFYASTVNDSNPMAWKEGNPCYGSKRTFFRLANLIFHGLVILFLLLVVDMNPRRLNGPFMFFHFILVLCLLVFIAILAAGAFARERQRNTFDVLLTTRLCGRRFVIGVLSGLLMTALPFWVMIGLYCLMGRVLQVEMRNEFVNIWMPVLNLMVMSLFFIVLGMYMSLICRTTTRAVLWTIGWFIIVFFVIPLSIVALCNSHYTDAEALFAMTPIFWLFCGVFPEQTVMFSNAIHYGSYIFFIGIHLFVPLLLFYYLSKNFDRLTGRQR